MLDKKLPNIINGRMNTLACCLGDMKCNLEEISTEKSELCVLFKHLQVSLTQPDDNCVADQSFNEILTSNMPVNLTSCVDHSKNLTQNLI